MATTHATRHDDLIELAKVWRSQTGSFRGRSSELKALDKALQDFARLGNLAAVEDSFAAWKGKYTANGKRWQDSHRNKSQWRTFERLQAILSAGGDSDAAYGAAPTFMQAHHVNARQGVLYLFGHIDVDTSVAAIILQGGMNIMGGALSYAGADIGKGGGLGITAAGDAATNIGTARVVIDDLVKIGDTGAAPPDAISARTRLATVGQSDAVKVFYEIKDRLRRWFIAFVNDLKTELMDNFGIVDMAIGSVTNLINVIVGALAAQAAPIVGGVMNMVTGLTQTIDRGMTNFKAWKAGKTVMLSEGHPTAVVSAITTAMRASLFEGLWTMLKGAASIGLATMAGISAIVDMVVAAVEMLVKVIWRLAECSKIKSFCTEAAAHWRQNNGIDFASKPFVFNSWFRKAARFMPAIPVLTLNSGICGDKMVFLQMFSQNENEGSRISQGEFDKGVTYIDGHLKPWGASYLKECAYGFTSGKSDVASYIAMAQQHASPEPENTLWKGFKRVVGA
jgi:hypothetical protein